MFVCKLRTPSCANYDNVHVYLAYRRQTGTRSNIRPSAPPNKTTHFCTHFNGCVLSKYSREHGIQNNCGLLMLNYGPQLNSIYSPTRELEGTTVVERPTTLFLSNTTQHRSIMIQDDLFPVPTRVLHLSQDHKRSPYTMLQ